MEETKICIRCKEEKNTSEFYFIKDTNKYNNQCKLCIITAQKENNSPAVREARKALLPTKVCKRCKQTKDASGFGSNEYKYYCTICRELRQKEVEFKFKNDELEKNSRKICSRCLIEQDISEFRKNKTVLACKSCLKIEQQNNRANLTEDKKKDRAEKQRKWNKNHQENIRESRKRTIENFSPEKRIKHRIRRNISSRIRQILRGSKHNISCLKYLPYTIPELKAHLESLFEPWMTWENWGPYNVETWDDKDKASWTWNIDHIRPCSTFNYTSMDSEEFRQCWALHNLRPLNAKQNISEGNRRYPYNKESIKEIVEEKEAEVPLAL